MLAEREAAAVMVSVRAGPVTANCHFVSTNEVELDIDPREVTGESTFEAVLAIMRLVAAAVRVPVFAVPEGGAPAVAFLRVQPDGRVDTRPAGSSR
jgi:hypothetical protein